MTLHSHLMTVGVISAQKKMLSVLTAWEENMPMMENATENFLFSESRRTVQEKDKKVSTAETPNTHLSWWMCVMYIPVSWWRLYFPITVFHWRALEGKRECQSEQGGTDRRTTAAWNNDLCTSPTKKKWVGRLDSDCEHTLTSFLCPRWDFTAF